MSVAISILNAVKKYGPNTVIDNLSLNIRPGEFFTLLGPSGCGKTTLLRMIAGFNSIEGGDFLFGEQRINDLDPAHRNIGMVFQNYAIFPHMNVRKNVAFGLKNRNVAPADITARTDRFMRLMHIDEYADRSPDRLSGGQQQRVALARALVIEPDVLLMDEPLSNLDAKLRVEMRTVIKRVQRDVGITTVYVTHDQEEAMAVSDRIAVMNAGVIQHVGAPQAIYHRPSNIFVATFIGRTNVIPGTLRDENGKALLDVCGCRVEVPGVRPAELRTRDVLVSIRPEEFQINRSGGTGLGITITDSIFLGLNTHYFARTDTGQDVEIIQESDIEGVLPAGTRITVRINTGKINLFDSDGTVNLLEGVADDNAAQAR